MPEEKYITQVQLQEELKEQRHYIMTEIQKSEVRLEEKMENIRNDSIQLQISFGKIEVMITSLSNQIDKFLNKEDYDQIKVENLTNEVTVLSTKIKMYTGLAAFIGAALGKFLFQI